jgi:nitroreductase
MTDRFEADRGTVHALIAAAVAAPSADNSHHVRFRIRPHGLDVRTDAFYDQCVEAHRRRLIELSFGAVGENLRIALRARGRDCELDWFPVADDRSLLLRLAWDTLVPCQADEPLAQHIETRHTNRKFFRGPPLVAGERAAFDTAMADRNDVRLDWFDEPARRASLLRLVRQAETERFRHRRHHEELFGSIDFSAGWKASTLEHLAPGSLEVEPPLRPMFAALRHWSVMRVANALGAATMLGFRAGDLPARLSPHVVALVASASSPRSSLAGGAAFQRVWLVADSLGLALQPMAASAVLADDALINARAGVDLPSAWRGLIGDGFSPVMVFRLGRARPPRTRSGRRPAESYVDP